MHVGFRSLIATGLLALAGWFTCAHAQTATDAPPILRLTDLFLQPVSSHGLTFTAQAQTLQSHTVRLIGYMVQQEHPTPGRFLLSPRPLMMSEDADGQADDLPVSTVAVFLDPSQQDWLVPHVRGPLDITGVLRLGRLETSDNRVFWVSLQLNESAVARLNHTP